MSPLDSSVNFINSVKEPLGLPRAIRKLVVVAEVGQPLWLIVQACVNRDSGKDIAKALTNESVTADIVADVIVTEMGEVIVTPLEAK